jgi:hypothetical protein
MRRALRAAAGGSIVVGLLACAPTAPPLRGDVAPARFPAAELAPVARKIVFRWTYQDRNFRVRGEGVARVAPPDSARLDFFIDGGLGGGRAVLVGDTLRAPDDQVEDFVPSPPLLWAALGRLSIGTPPDTMARIAGDTLRADIGRGPRWRVAFVGDSLRELTRIEDGKVRQYVTRASDGGVRFRDVRGGRELRLTITRIDTVSDGFDAAIFR